MYVPLSVVVDGIRHCFSHCHLSRQIFTWQFEMKYRRKMGDFCSSLLQNFSMWPVNGNYRPMHKNYFCTAAISIEINFSSTHKIQNDFRFNLRHNFLTLPTEKNMKTQVARMTSDGNEKSQFSVFFCQLLCQVKRKNFPLNHAHVLLKRIYITN